MMEALVLLKVNYIFNENILETRLRCLGVKILDIILDKTIFSIKCFGQKMFWVKKFFLTKNFF